MPYPTATFELPVVLDCKEAGPTRILVPILPAPRPTTTPLKDESDVTVRNVELTVLAVTVLAVAVPVNVGDALRTLLPVPVLVVTPVPPLATARVPVA